MEIFSEEKQTGNGLLRAGVPAGQVPPLLISQLVDTYPETRQLQPRDLLVDVLGHVMHARRQVVGVLRDVQRAQRLVGKLMSITAAGCPSADARFSTRPSASR